MTSEYMNEKINEFISDNDGTEEGEAVYRKRRDLFDDDYKGIKTLYESIFPT